MPHGSCGLKITKPQYQTKLSLMVKHIHYKEKTNFSNFFT